MTTRSFTDAGGRRWVVWRVMPYAADRRQHERRLEIEGLDGERDGLEPRSGDERRMDPTRADAPDRRSGVERRQIESRRGEDDRRSGVDRRTAPRIKAPLPGSYGTGWLCFESDGEKRRLAPVPDGWETSDDECLVECLGRAVQSRRATAS